MTTMLLLASDIDSMSWPEVVYGLGGFTLVAFVLWLLLR